MPVIASLPEKNRGPSPGKAFGRFLAYLPFLYACRSLTLALAIPLGSLVLVAAPTQVPAETSQPAPAPRVTLIVRVQSEGRNVAGATVTIDSLEEYSDAQGVARLDLPTGTHTLRVRAEGYFEFTTTVALSAQETSLEIELLPQVEIQEEIIVRAARTDRRLDDQPMRIEVVDREEIEEKALMTPGSVAMLLDETTGLRVQTTAPSIGAANVRIQGLRGRYSQLLSDGLPLYGLQGDSLSLLQAPPLDLGQVEIIKGAASALYGASALGGVINLVSQRPTTRHRELLMNVSTHQAADLTFWMVEPPQQKWAFTLIGGFHGRPRKDVDDDGWADLPNYSRGVVRPRFFWEDARGRSVFATAGVMAENRRGGTVPGSAAPDGQAFPEHLDSRRLDSGTVIRLPAGDRGLFTLRSSFSYKAEDRSFGSSFESGRRITWFGEFVYQGSAGRHVWLIGGAVQQDDYHNRDLQGFDYSFVTPGLIAQDEISLSDKLTIGISGRLDRHSRYGTFASPRVSLLYKASPAWRVRLSAGTGFFAPTPFVEETEEVGLSRLRPLDGIAAEEAGSGSMDVSWTRGPLELVGTIFGSAVRHPVEYEFVGHNLAALVNSTEPVRTWGTEFLARYRVEGFVLLATHNFTSSTEGSPGDAGRREVPLTPRHSASLNAIWEGESWGRFGLEAYFVGRQGLEYNPYRTVGRSYLLVGALLERRLGRLRLFINLENLTDVRQTHWDPLLRPAPLPDGRWAVDAWSPLDGRVVNGGVRVSF